MLLIGETADLLEYYDYDAYTQPTPNGKVPQNFENAGGSWDEGIVDSAKVKWHTVYVDERVQDMFTDGDPETWFEENYPRLEYCDDIDCVRSYTEQGSDRQQMEQDMTYAVRDFEYEMRPLFMDFSGRSYKPEADMPPELLPFQKAYGELSYELAVADEEDISPAYLYPKFKEFRAQLAPVLQKLGKELQPSEHEEYLDAA